MSRKRMVRVAAIRFTPYGKSYVARCDREDIDVGSAVVVLMHAGKADEFLTDAIVTGIQYEPWHCSCQVLYRVEEAPRLAFGELSPSTSNISESAAAHNEMAELYECLTIEDGQDVYLSDGVWLSSEGSLQTEPTYRN